MDNNLKQKYCIQYKFTEVFTLAAITLSISSLAIAKSEGASTGNLMAEFDTGFLIGDAKKIDITKFATGNPILPGEYSLDVYINGGWYGKQSIIFKPSEDDTNAFTCFTAKQLLQYGVKADAINQKPMFASNNCEELEKWISGAFYSFDVSNLKLEVSIPQIALQQNARGYVDPKVWDRGINAAFVSYSANTYKTLDKINNQKRANAFISLNTGVNLAGWQLRHNGHWSWFETDEDSHSHYNAVNTYLQRAIPEYRSVLTLGDSYSDGNIFDSYSYRGVAISSDDRMLPSSMTGYAPRVRGTARTNAKVEIRQEGRLIYQTTVVPGRFEINDLYPTGFGGELDVSIIEADGVIQKFSIPYTSVAQMLRPEMNRYAIIGGQYRGANTDKKPLIIQGQYQRGLNNYVTGYGGIQGSENYHAVSLGSAFATPLGAVAFDVTHSDTEFANRETQKGQSYRISYSKLFGATNTNITLAAYRYSTQGFYKLSDALKAQQQDSEGVGSDYFSRQRSEFQVTLNQGLPSNWGNLYLTGSWSDYWDNQAKTKQYQVGYSNTFKGLSYGLSANKRVVENSSAGSVVDDTQYMLSLSLPLSIKRSALNLSSYSTKDNSTIGVSGVLNRRLNYGATLSNDYGEKNSLTTNVEYRTNTATFAGSFSIADEYEQVGLSASGTLVAHDDGIVAGPDQGRTMVLVHAPDAEGAKVNNTSELTINKSGYAVIPYVTPYRINDISLDTVSMSADVELEGTSQRIAPYDGSITKVNFKTKAGKAIYIQALDVDGNSLPFGADIIGSKQENLGIVAQGSLVYLRTKELKDSVIVKWGESKNEQCQISYDISNQAENSQDNIIMLEGICRDL